MSQIPYEAKLLANAEAVLADEIRRMDCAAAYETRLQMLEAVAARMGGINPADYWRAFGIEPLLTKRMNASVDALDHALSRSRIPAHLALSALSREPLGENARRTTGAYYTDFRLAKHLAASFRGRIRPGMRVLDPASGSGILLLALSAQAIAEGVDAARWIAESIYAADLSAFALRAARIGFLPLANDLGVVMEMAARWRAQDSLLATSESWKSLAPSGFDIVVANPPWEKVKLTRHEFLKGVGVKRDYGSEYQGIDENELEAQRRTVSNYGERLALRYSAMNGEPDLYVAFSELILDLVRPGGEVGLIVPAGLIRSQGTSELRELMWRNAEQTRIEILENRARFFEIDSRFKFLMVRMRRNASMGHDCPIELIHSWGAADGVTSSPAVIVEPAALRRARPDLSIPEVKNDAEWRIFRTIVSNGENWGDSKSDWHPRFMREVDMTRDKAVFERVPLCGTIPVVEGRMVHQHRFGVKSYQGGSGRSAIWSTNPIGTSRIEPQYWLHASRLPSRVRQRVSRARPGFCDITGQTNARSMLAAAVPAGVVCGNKVPTVTFPNDDRPEREWLWLSVVNSLPFDWALRRVITTTVNYFLLVSIPLPAISPDSVEGSRLVDIAKILHAEDSSGPKSTARRQHFAELRAEADLMVLRAYGLTCDDLPIILADFPLLDRAQPPLYGEESSTVTRDLLLSRAFDGCDEGLKAADRLDRALLVGAVAYEASHLVAVEARDVVVYG